jgi:hypothetical protein
VSARAYAPAGIAPATCAAALNDLRHIRLTFFKLQTAEDDERERQALTDIILHLEAAMEIMYRYSVMRPEDL